MLKLDAKITGMTSPQMDSLADVSAPLYRLCSFQKPHLTPPPPPRGRGGGSQSIEQTEKELDCAVMITGWAAWTEFPYLQSPYQSISLACVARYS